MVRRDGTTTSCILSLLRYRYVHLIKVSQRPCQQHHKTIFEFRSRFIYLYVHTQLLFSCPLQRTHTHIQTHTHRPCHVSYATSAPPSLYSVGPRRTPRLSTSTLHYNTYKGKVEVAQERYGHIQPPIHIYIYSSDCTEHAYIRRWSKGI